MQKVINQIYWNSTLNTYMPGSQITKYANYYVNFKNLQMASGKVIIYWDSSHNYQEVKEVPKLPMLINGHEYQLNVFLFAYPMNSLIYRLTFYGVQGNIIDHFVFTSYQKRFVYPKDAKSYTFEIINGGCETIGFERVQISDVVDEKAYGDLFFDQLPILNKRRVKDNLILVADNKRVRKQQTDLKRRLISGHPFTVVYVSWQYDGDLTTDLDHWIANHNIYGYRVFCTARCFDEIAVKVNEAFPQAEVLTTQDLFQDESDKNKPHSILKSRCYDPDWHEITHAINTYLGGEINDIR